MKIQYNAAVLILFMSLSFCFYYSGCPMQEGLIPRFLLYKSLVHPHLENCSGVWDPYKISDGPGRYFTKGTTREAAV